MNSVLIGLGLGLAAALLDIVPMLIQRLSLLACLSAAAQWLFLGVVITRCDVGLPGWATGLVLGLAGAIPIILVTIGNPAMVKPGEEAKTVIPIVVFSAILGTAIGVVSRLIKQ